MVGNRFKDLYNMGEDYVFSGLSNSSINFLREEGMWGPIDQTLLEKLPDLSNKLDLIYVSRIDTNRDVLMFLLVEQGEYLQGIVYDFIHEKGQLPVTLHEYQLVNGTTAKEGEQIVIGDNLFLCLYGKDNIIISEWTTEEIDKYLESIDY